MTYQFTKIILCIFIAASVLSLHVYANEEYLCTEGPDGEQDCEAVYFDSDIYQDSGDESGEKVDDGAWRSQLAVEECTDHGDECTSLAENDECNTNPGYMKYQCAKSCNTCDEFDAAYEALRDGTGDGPCTDRYRECKNWAHMGECSFNPNFMLVECERSCMICFEDT